MNEITRVILENEMDLILAHKQCMKLAEFAGMSLPAQTTFATAVSEVSRNAIGTINHSCLILSVSDKKEKIKYVTATLEDKRKNFSTVNDEGFSYARKLVANINVSSTDEGNKIALNLRVPPQCRIDDSVIEKWRISLNTDPAVSPYEEIKRKNRQLVELADKLRVSEQQYRSLTDSLPLMIFTISNDGTVTYANQWLEEYTGETIADLNKTRWERVLHPQDFENGWQGLEQHTANSSNAFVRERRFRHAHTGEYRWHSGVSIAMRDDDGDVVCWNTYFVDIHAQKIIEQTLKDNVELKEIQAELRDKIELLNKSNHQLEQFAYIASHDLQEPLRKIGFYSDFLNKKYAQHLPNEARMFFNNLLNATDRMKLLIQDVLSYSTVRQGEFTLVELDKIAADVIDDLEISISEKNAEISIGKLPVIEGIPRQLKQLFENLISNSLKFSRSEVRPEIHISVAIEKDYTILSFEDNGIGFEDKYIDRMFDLFQQLHNRDKYKGTGIGLAICKKIVDIHHGVINASGKLDEGAIFKITLPLNQNKIK